MVLLKNTVELQWGVDKMVSYIGAQVAVARTKNARQSDSYIAQNTIHPILMAQIMQGILDASHEGMGEYVYYINSKQFDEYNEKAIEMGKTLMENTMATLGYRIVQKDENTYQFVWLSE